MLIKLGFCVHRTEHMVPRIRIDINGKTVDMNLDLAGNIDDLLANQHIFFTRCQSLPNNQIKITLLNHIDGDFGFQVRTVEIDHNDLLYFGVTSTVTNKGFGTQTGLDCNYVHIENGTYEIHFEYPLFDFLKKQNFGRLLGDHLK